MTPRQAPTSKKKKERKFLPLWTQKKRWTFYAFPIFFVSSNIFKSLTKSWPWGFLYFRGESIILCGQNYAKESFQTFHFSLILKKSSVRGHISYQQLNTTCIYILHPYKQSIEYLSEKASQRWNAEFKLAQVQINQSSYIFAYLIRTPPFFLPLQLALLLEQKVTQRVFFSIWSLYNSKLCCIGINRFWFVGLFESLRVLLGVLQQKLAGGVRPVSQNPYLFMNKICDIPYYIHGLTLKSKPW